MSGCGQTWEGGGGDLTRKLIPLKRNKELSLGASQARSSPCQGWGRAPGRRALLAPQLGAQRAEAEGGAWGKLALVPTQRCGQATPLYCHSQTDHPAGRSHTKALRSGKPWRPSGPTSGCLRCPQPPNRLIAKLGPESKPSGFSQPKAFSGTRNTPASRGPLRGCLNTEKADGGGSVGGPLVLRPRA